MDKHGGRVDKHGGGVNKDGGRGGQTWGEGVDKVRGRGTKWGQGHLAA